MKKESPIQSVNVLIIGAGPSGVAVADSLRTQGIESHILDAGIIPPVIAGEKSYRNMQEYRHLLQPYLEVDQDQWSYTSNSSDYDWIRVRSCGGRTLLWNGWLANPDKDNFSFPEIYGKTWPFSSSELDALLDRSMKFLGAKTSLLAPRYQQLSKEIGCDIFPKVAAVSGEPVRPFCAIDKLIEAKIHGSNGAKIHLTEQAIVTQLLFGKQGIEAVEYFDIKSNERRRIKANIVVLCASAIETTRLLLASDFDHLSDVNHLVGKTYTDHFAASYLAIIPEKFSGVPLASPLERGATIPRPMGMSRNLAQRGGFTLELHGPNPPSIYEPEVLAEVGLEGNAEVSCYSVNAMGELCSSPHRNITLADSVDSIGRNMPKINFAWDDEVRILAATMEKEAARVATALAGPGGRAIRARKTLSIGGTGVSHEASTCPIGRSDKNSVVNRNGQVHGVNGLFIADSSLMPTGLDCHPTLTVVALALNTADGIIDHIRNSHLTLRKT